MGFFESFEGSERMAPRRARMSLHRQAELFFESLTGEALPSARRAPSAPAIPQWQPPVEARAPWPAEWDVDTDAETVPTFAVGAADTVDTTPQYVEMPARVEAWVPNAAGTGIVIADFSCSTLAELTATTPNAGPRLAAPGAARLWRTTGKLQALLEVLVFHPATVAGGNVLPAGRHPLAIICHGNHNAVEAGVEVLSHHGYSGFTPSPPAQAPYLQEALAERGIISASVNMNPANVLDLLLETRAQLAIAALRKMQQLDRDRTPGNRYHRKIDFQRVALIGHSRGGDAVARAMRLVPSDTRVRALVQIAPTDSTGILQGAAPTTLARPAGSPAPTFVTRPGTIPEGGSPKQLIIWGSRDGDVSGAEDVRADLAVNPFRHYDRSAVERAFQFWHGATHNRFNRKWTDPYEDSFCLSRIVADPAGLLTRTEQEARTIEMVRGWLLFALYDETSEASKFDGRTATAVAPTKKIAGIWKFGPRLLTIDQFDDVQPARNTLGGANVTPATGVFDEITVANENATGAGLTAYQFPHIDRALRYSPAPAPTLTPQPQTVPGLPTTVSAPLWRTTIPAGSAARDFRRFDVLTFRVTKKYDPTWLRPVGSNPVRAKQPEVKVRLIGSNAQTHTTTATGRLSTLPVVREIPAVSGCGGPFDLTKVHYETWEVDLAVYKAAMSISSIAFVELEIKTEVGQSVYVDTVSLVKRP